MTNDLISREALKKQFEELHLHPDLIDLIDNAPTVKYTFEEAFQKTVCEQRLYCPARPQGEWIRSEYVDTRRGFITKCPFCKTDTIGGGNFCPNCGADMRGGAE